MDLLLGLVWCLLEIFFELIFEIVWGAGRAVIDSLEPSTLDAVLSAIAYFLVGLILGVLSAWALPDPLLPPPRTRGLSLLLSPLLSGFAMHTWGAFRRDRGRPASTLATFYGGAAFALGAALGRFLLVA